MGRSNSRSRRSVPMGVVDRFHASADTITRAVGTPWAMLAAVAVVVVWALTGPIFGFSDTWQLVINTGTTIVTFLMVFAIQTSQNREAMAMHIKLDELIRSNPEARKRLMAEEMASEEQLEEDERAMLRSARARGRTYRSASDSGRSRTHSGPPGE